MAENDTGAAMDMEDINLPLDEIISRKANRDGAARPLRGRGFRKHPYQQRRQTPPLPPPSFNQVEHPPIPDQTGPIQLPPYFHQDPNFTPQPYNWDHPGGAGGFTPNPMEQCWMAPQPMGQGDVSFRRRQPLKKRGFNRGGIQKPIVRGYPPRRLSQDHHHHHHRHHHRPVRTDDEKQREEERCKLQFEKGVATILYCGVEIVKASSTGDVTLTTNGSQENGFLKAMNDALSLINIEILGEEDKKDQWKVKDNRTLFRYYDGISIKGKGELSKSRAETIRKAFEQPNPKALEATLASNLAARRLGLAFDPMSANAQSQFPNTGPPHHGMTPNGGSICITQDQQLTRTSNYSISFLDQERAQHEGAYGPVYHPPPGPMPQGGRFLHPY